MSATQIRRFVLSQRIEHALLILSFTTLAVTGLPQKYVGHPLADGLIALMGGIELVRIVHRVAATLLMLETVYHVGVVAYKIFVRRSRLTMLPTVRDALDAWQAFLHNLGLRKQPPQMGRYTFEEKAEYWALLWGTVIMIITGFMLWNPIATAQFVPGQFIPAAKAAHGGEAVLAVLAIIVWHMYGVHLRRFNKSMWTGSLTEAEMLHEHPLELADIKAGEAERPVDPAALQRSRRLFIPIAGATTLALAIGLYVFVTFEQTAISTLPARQAVDVFAPQTPTPLPPTATPPPVEALTWNGYFGSLFAAECSGCHGQAGGLSLATHERALRGGRGGPVIVPGDSGGSLIVTLMEAGGHPGELPDEALARLKQWIDSGAPED